MPWPQTLLDGFAGGAVGSLGAFLAALYVVKKQAHSDARGRRSRVAEISLPLLADLSIALAENLDADIEDSGTIIKGNLVVLRRVGTLLSLLPSVAPGTLENLDELLGRLLVFTPKKAK